MQVFFYALIVPFSFVVAIFNIIGFRLKYYLVSEKFINRNVQYSIMVWHVVLSALPALFLVNNELNKNCYFEELYAEYQQAIPMTMFGLFLINCMVLGWLIEGILGLFVKGYREAGILETKYKRQRRR